MGAPVVWRDGMLDGRGVFSPAVWQGVPAMGRGSDVRKSPRSHCPVSLALEAVGDKWSLLILRDLILRGKSRYQELLDSGEGISTNILADRLVKLEQLGLILKSDDPTDKRQVRYLPTQKGLDLLPVILEMARWSYKYDPNTDRASPFFKRTKALFRLVGKPRK
jgi:DNA-binding HxlR family transcriptional regulator